MKIISKSSQCFDLYRRCSILRKHSGIIYSQLIRVFVNLFLADEDSGERSTLKHNNCKKSLLKSRRMILRSLSYTQARMWSSRPRMDRGYRWKILPPKWDFNLIKYFVFGSQCLRIKTASETFCHKKNSDLAVQEAAVLVGYLKAPTSLQSVYIQ